MLLHFAYGSNMDRALMRRHCPQGRALGIATLDRHRFIINSDGYASIVPERRAVVHGVLWRLSDRDVVTLDAYESIATGLYRRETMMVRAHNRPVSAMVYIGRAARPGAPRPGYLDIVTTAARDWKLPADYVMALARWDGRAGLPANSEGVA